jgi:drug/metabolite transporter (DMT)-like permease
MRYRYRQATEQTKGTVLIMASTAAFCLMSVFLRCASNIDAYKTTLFRFVVGLGILGTAALFGKIRLHFTNGPLLFLRGLIGGTGVLIFFWSIPKLGIGKATVLLYSFPIFATVFSAVLLKEKVGSIRLAAIVLAFVGIALLGSRSDNGLSIAGSFDRYELLALLGAVLGGLALVVVKKLHDTDSSYAIFFAQCVIGLWIVVVPANTIPCSVGLSGGLLLVAIGVTSATGQLLSTEGYRHLPVAKASLLGMLVPAFNYVLGAVVFAEPVSVRSIIGAATILGACAVVLLENNRKSTQKQRQIERP